MSGVELPVAGAGLGKGFHCLDEGRLIRSGREVHRAQVPWSHSCGRPRTCPSPPTRWGTSPHPSCPSGGQAPTTARRPHLLGNHDRWDARPSHSPRRPRVRAPLPLDEACAVCEVMAGGGSRHGWERQERLIPVDRYAPSSASSVPSSASARAPCGPALTSGPLGGPRAHLDATHCQWHKESCWT